MSIENTLERIATALEAIAAGQAPVVTGSDEAPKPARAPRAAKPKDADTSSTTTTEAAPASGETETETPPASSTDDDQSASTLTYEADVKPLILKVGGTKGRDAAIALLGEFDVDKGDKLDPAQWSAFIARANEVLG